MRLVVLTVLMICAAAQPSFPEPRPLAIDFREDRLAIDPEAQEVPEGSSLPLRLRPVCNGPCTADDTDTMLYSAKPEIIWQVNGVTGGDDKVGRVIPAARDREGRVTAVIYNSPMHRPADNPVAVTAMITDAEFGQQYQYVANIDVVDAGTWTGWVHVHFSGTYDGAEGTSGNRIFEEQWGETPIFSSPDLGAMPIDVAWLEYDTHFTITDAFVEASDDTGMLAMLTGGASGRMTYKARWQNACGSYGMTDRIGHAVVSDPMTRLVQFQTRWITSDSTVPAIAPLIFDVEGQSQSWICDTMGLTASDPEPYREKTEALGLVDRVITTEVPLPATGCDWSTASTYAESVNYVGKDLEGVTTVTWCISRN